MSSEHKGPRYKVEKEIGRGAFGVVYLAKDNVLRRSVALKVMSIPDGLTADEKQHLVDRFYHEARAAAGLSHPNIVTIHDISKAKDRHFISMEFLEGIPLSDLIDSGESVSLGRAMNIADQALAGLAYAHEKSVIHRDVKPDNIFLLDGDTVKIVDFGLARVQASTTITRTGTVMGSPGYISPEVIDGKPADSRTDVFSFGVVLYEMLTGSRPFGPDTAFESFVRVIYRIMSEEPKPLAEVDPELPEAIQVVIYRMLAKDPDERYQDAGEARAALDEATSGLGLDYEAGTVPRRRKTRPSKGTADLSAAQTLTGDEPAGADDDSVRTEIVRFEEYLVQEGEHKRSKGRIALIISGTLLGLAGITMLLLFLFGVFASGDVKVPNVINLDQVAAVKTIKEAGLKVGALEEVFSYDIWKGKVAQQKPAAGQTVPADSTVDIKVSMGGEVAMVPKDLIGMTTEQARALLTSYHFKAKIEQGYSGSVPAGCVFDTDPEVETVKPYGTVVTLVINSGIPESSGDTAPRSLPTLPRRTSVPILPRR